MMIFIAFVVGILASPVIWPLCKKAWKAVDKFMDGSN